MTFFTNRSNFWLMHITKIHISKKKWLVVRLWRETYWMSFALLKRLVIRNLWEACTHFTSNWSWSEGHLPLPSNQLGSMRSVERTWEGVSTTLTTHFTRLFGLLNSVFWWNCIIFFPRYFCWSLLQTKPKILLVNAENYQTRPTVGRTFA